MPADRPATLAAWLRTRSDAELAALLAARPDVTRPAPADVVALASRLAVPVSVDRALDELDAATLQVLDVVLLAPTDGAEGGDAAAALPGARDDVPAAAPPRGPHAPRLPPPDGVEGGGVAAALPGLPNDVLDAAVDRLTTRALL